MMSVPAALVLGILIGWLIEWVIDWVYWRRRSGNPGEMQRLQREVARLKAQMHHHKDPLEVIHGIGPVISARLYDAGVFTYAALAELTQDEVEEIIGPEIVNLADEKSLIREARKLAEMQRKVEN
jgi:predicted flap endonuclease-1-like 5' DNA nuclease